MQHRGPPTRQAPASPASPARATLVHRVTCSMVLKVHPTVVHYHFTWCFIGDGRGTVRQTVPRPGVLLDVVDSELRLAWRRDDWRRHDDDRCLKAA